MVLEETGHGHVRQQAREGFAQASVGPAAEAVQVPGVLGVGQVAIWVVARGGVEKGGKAMAEDGSEKDVGAFGDRTVVDVDRPKGPAEHHGSHRVQPRSLTQRPVEAGHAVHGRQVQ